MGCCLCREVKRFLTGSPVKRRGPRGCFKPTDVREGPAAPHLSPLAPKVPNTELWPWQRIRKRPQRHSAQQLSRGRPPSVMPSTAPALLCQHHRDHFAAAMPPSWHHQAAPGLQPQSQGEPAHGWLRDVGKGGPVAEGSGQPRRPSACCGLVVAFLLGSHHRLQSDRPEPGPAGTQLGQERGRR